MQSPSQQTVTWAVVALEALKYLGPATIVLIGSLVTLWHQRVSRQRELEAGARLKARELVFNHYQKRLDKVSATSENLGDTFAQFQILLLSPESDARQAVTDFFKSLISISLSAKHEVGNLEAELEAFGLRKKYQGEIDEINKAVNQTWKIEGDIQQQVDSLRTMLLSMVVVQEALLTARMKELFQEYLPPRSKSLVSK